MCHGVCLLQFHHAFHFQVLIALGAVGGEIDGGIVLDELAHTIECFAGCLLVWSSLLTTLIATYVFCGNERCQTGRQCY